jgi:hypothetical protein
LRSIVTSWVVLASITLATVACGARAPSRPGGADDISQPGEPVAEPSTFHSLGIRWPVRGDANADALTGVQYRRRGDAAWQAALPLFRTNPAAVSDENRVAKGWLFAGSIVDLQPDTEYEVALTLTDPDGGGAQRMLTMRTGVEPREPAGMRVRHVVPAGPGGGGTGTADDPFRGLRGAQLTAAPGDLFLRTRACTPRAPGPSTGTGRRSGRSSTGARVTVRPSSTEAGASGSSAPPA